MLKIKDSVDLKELEKWGFELNEYINDFNIKDWNNVIHLDEKNNIMEQIPPLDRKEINWAEYEKGHYPEKTLSINVFDKTDYSEELKFVERTIHDEDSGLDLDTLYDLIKADLVEKI